MTYFGKGIYSLTTAAKILKMNPQKMHRWIKGYTYYKNTECRSIKPIFKTEFDYDSDDMIISFLDLTELLFINAFIDYDISIQKIRKAAIAASKILQTRHPFAMRKIYTDGKSIFGKIAEEVNDPSLLDLINSQYQFAKIIEPTLYKCIDFNKHEEFAERWWPLGKKMGIVLDPSRNMGQPILNKYNVRTELIYELHKTNHSIDEISDWYELDKNTIDMAISFEKGLAA
ncbi:MAG: DUF433 domain-containing protein [Treponema sp.]|nr:DUF433 domain-containing protein [Treponema sp.]